MPGAKPAKPKQGDVFEVPLDPGRYGYGQVLGPALLGFYAIEADQRLALAEVVTRPVAFRIECTEGEIKGGRWPVLGNVELPPAMRAPLALWRQNGPDFIFLYEWLPDTGGDERRVSSAEIVGVEKSGIWDSNSAVERLKMHLRGEPCPWVELG